MDNEQPGAQAVPAGPDPLMVDWQTVCVILMERFLPMGSRAVTITEEDVMGMTKREYAPAGPVVSIRPTGPNSMQLSLHTVAEAEELARQYDAERERAANDPASVAPVSDRVQ